MEVRINGYLQIYRTTIHGGNRPCGRHTRCHTSRAGFRPSACPGVDDGTLKDIGIIFTKSTDMTGTVSAPGATRCTIKFRDKHKTAPYCRVVTNEAFYVTTKVLRTSRTEVTFTFDPPLKDADGFEYECVFRD